MRCLPSPTYSIWNPVDSSAHFSRPNWLVQCPVHWTPTGLQATFQSPVPVQLTESQVKVHWSLVESTGPDTIPCIVENINTIKYQTLTSTTHHMDEGMNNITASPSRHYKIIHQPHLILLWLGHAQIDCWQMPMLDLDVVNSPHHTSATTTIIHNIPCCQHFPFLHHFSHPFLGTYEVVQFFDLGYLKGTHSGGWYTAPYPFHGILG